MQPHIHHEPNGFQTPGADLLRQVRAGFVAQGTSYTRWCRENGVLRANANQALIGAWDGPKAKKLRRRIIEASRIQTALEA